MALRATCTGCSSAAYPNEPDLPAHQDPPPAHPFSTDSLVKEPTIHCHPVSSPGSSTTNAAAPVISGIVSPSPPERVRRVGGALSSRSTKPCQPVFSPPHLFFSVASEPAKHKRQKRNRSTKTDRNPPCDDVLVQQCQWLNTTKNRPHRRNHQGRLAAGAGV